MINRKIIMMVVVTVILVVTVTGEASLVETTEQAGCPIGEVYRQYRCQADFGDACDPYILHAQSDELFCEMIVYTERPRSEPYIRTVSGEVCYPDPPYTGYTCMALFSDLAAVWTEGDAYGIHSIYVNSVRRNVQFAPLIYK